jgi:hypothetical protein
VENRTLVFPILVDDNVAQNCKAEMEQYLENNKKLIPHYYKVPQLLCFWDGEENF